MTLETVASIPFQIWFLIGAALVFFMQAGFAMAERTKFSAYCIYSGIISLLVYPIEAGWIWNEDGWLAGLGYIDFAGSSAIHMVGGISSIIGAAVLGPRIGKYITDPKTGKKTPRAIPGHSLTLGALDQIGISGMTVTQVLGCGMQKGNRDFYRGVPLETTLLPKIKVETVICKIPLELLIDTVKKAL